MGLPSVSQAPFERALEQPSWAGRVWTTQRRRTERAKRPRPCPRAAGGRKSRPGCLVEAPVGACQEQGLATLCRALQVPGAVQALAHLQPRARRRTEAGCRLKPAPVLRGATAPSSSRSSTGRAGRDRGPKVRPCAPHRPLRARHDPCHPLHRSRTARRPHAPFDPPSPLGRLTPLPARLRRRSRQAVGRRAGSTTARGGGEAAAAWSAQAARTIPPRGGGLGAALARAARSRRLEPPPADGGLFGSPTLETFLLRAPMLKQGVF